MAAFLLKISDLRRMWSARSNDRKRGLPIWCTPAHGTRTGAIERLTFDSDDVEQNMGQKPRK